MMWIDALLAYLHFATIFALLATLLHEWLLLRRGAGALDLERIAKVDGHFGLASIAVLASGAARVLLGAKGWALYAHSPMFHLKITLFIAVGLLSILPTVRYLRWRRARRADPAFVVPPSQWRGVRRVVLVELHLLALIPLAAVAMARGLWF